MDEHSEVGSPGIDEYASALADCIEAALPAWVRGAVSRLMTAWSGTEPADVVAAAAQAGEAARTEVGSRVRSLLALDIDQQPTTPLSLLRSAVRYPTEVLAGAGVPALERDGFAVRAFPDDIYDLSPATWADFGPEVAEAGIVWGAAKAFEHRRRHQ